MAAWRYASQDYRTFSDHLYENDKHYHQSDYDDFYIATREEAEEQIETGKQLLELIEEYIKRKLKDNNKWWSQKIPSTVTLCKVFFCSAPCVVM